MTTVILCDEQGNPCGTAEKTSAHVGSGQLHRAFSVYTFRHNRSELLIQKRSEEKMLWPGIWANSCCSHPGEGEDVVEAGERRLQEELGFTCSLTEGPSFVYRAEDGDRGVEHEYLTLLIGEVDDVSVAPNPAEVAEWKWVKTASLAHNMQQNLELYAPWFHLGFQALLSPENDA